MFYAKKIVAALAVPPFGLILLALFGLALARRHPRLGRGLASLALAALATLSIPAVADALLRTLETVPPVSDRELARGQAIVVLGAGAYHDAPEYGGDTVERNALLRLRYAARLQRRSGLPLLVTGGAPSGGRPEGELMRAVLENDFRVPVRWAETASRDTAENAALSAPLLRAAGVRRIVLVSQAWHLRRATELFRRQGFTVIPAPTGFSTDAPSRLQNLLPSPVALERSYAAIHEWLGILVQRVAPATP